MVLTNLSELRGVLSDIVNDTTDKRVWVAKMGLFDDIIRDTEEYVPYDTGELTSSVEVTDDSIAYTADYAEYVNAMPSTVNFSRRVHHQATSNWVEASILENRGKWLDNFRRRVGGK